MEYEIVIISLFLSALFSGLEIAFYSANKLRIELSNKQGTLTGKILSKFIHAPSRFIGAILIGNNIALVVYGIMMAKILEPLILKYSPVAIQSAFLLMFIQVIGSTSLVLIVGEFFPKLFARLNADRMVYALAIPFYVIYWILYPLVWIVLSISRFFFSNIFGIEHEDNKPVFGKVDLQYLMERKTPEVEEEEVDSTLFQNALQLAKVQARECMVPRTEIIGLDVNASIDELQAVFVKSGHSKIIIYNNNIDNILGYVHHFDLWKKIKDIKSVINKTVNVPETISAQELLDKFIKEQKSIACVVDEFGGTAGIVTLEDVLEEIFGEINDEHDSTQLIEKKINADTYIFSGRMEIDYLNDKYNLEIPLGDYETLAGFIMDSYGDIPVMNEQIEIGNMLFTIMYVSDTKIDTVKLKLKS